MTGRAASPIRDGKTTILNGRTSGETGKIYRIPLVRSARVHVCHVESPNLFWVRPTNHITEQLQFSIPCENLKPIVKKLRVREWCYILAPIDPTTYARARVLKQMKLDDQLFLLVIFIDDGTRAWITQASAAEMPHHFYYHPWQAIACSLFKVLPALRSPESEDRRWSLSSISTFRALLQDFPLFLVSVAPSSVHSNDAREPVKVELFGLKSDEEDAKAFSIAHIFARRCLWQAELARKMFDARAMGPQPLADVEQWEMNPPVVLESWRSTWPTATIAPRNPSQDDSHQATDFFPQIPLITVRWLKTHGFEYNGEYLVHIEGRHTISPYEFYGRLLKYETTMEPFHGANEKETTQLKEGDMIVTANERLMQFADVLNAHYGQPGNRRQIDVGAVESALTRGERVYGIVEMEDELAAFTGLWQRVQLLGLSGSREGSGSRFVRVRYLDSGGSEIRSLSSVLRISPEHCQQAPFCLQMSFHGLKPRQCGSTGLWQSTQRGTQLKWDQGALYRFRQLLREDVPISVALYGRLNKARDGEPFDYTTPAWERPDVLFAFMVKARGSEKTVNEMLLIAGPGGTPPIAVEDENVPVALVDGADE